MKIDIFVPKGRPFDRSIFERVRYVSLEPEAPRPYALPTPEDIILLKLEWYELSHRASLHQWPDVLGVIQGQYDVLDGCGNARHDHRATPARPGGARPLPDDLRPTG